MNEKKGDGAVRDSFSDYHPTVIFIYFAGAIILGMFFMHPALLLISAGSAFLYFTYLGGKKSAAAGLSILFAVTLTAGAVNMLFNHRGVTVLFYLRGNPITLESAVYGILAGLMISTMIIWGACASKVLTSDKIMYLLGRKLPVFALLFSMILRFVPRFTAKAREISEGQKAISGNVIGNSALTNAANAAVRRPKNRPQNPVFCTNVKYGLRTASILTTWALENAVDTADSMKSRGYGLAGRTSFSVYRFDRRDGMAVIWEAVLIGTAAACAKTGAGAFQCFPMIKTAEVTVITAVLMTSYALLLLLPVIINVREEIKWHYLQSRI